MKLYSYIVCKNDGGFAPNPFFGYCTLACCKPGVRKNADIGDWVIGLTPKAKGNKIVYFMQVEESLTFDQYWKDRRFKRKSPKKDADRVDKLGDNIYKPSKESVDEYIQQWSAHSSESEGVPGRAGEPGNKEEGPQRSAGSDFTELHLLRIEASELAQSPESSDCRAQLQGQPF